MNISANISAIQTNQSFLNTTANDIAGKKPDLTKDIPNLILAQRTNEANVNAIKTQNEILGSLLDIKA